jgi:hypothetical protein
VVEEESYQLLLHFVILFGSDLARLFLPESIVLVLADRADEMEAGEAISCGVFVIEIVFIGL